MSGTVTWIVIALAQYKFRKAYLREGGKLSDLKYRAPWFPLVPLTCIVLCCSLFVFLALDETQRPSLYWGGGFIALCYSAYFLIYRKRQGVLAPSLPSV
jgi:arginine/ornithine permease